MKYMSKKHLIAFLVLAVFGIAGFKVWNSVQSKNVDRVSVENKTRSLSVESIKDLGENADLSIFEVKVKNNYDKPIVMYRFRISDETTPKGEINGVEKGGLVDDWTLKPNETTVTRFSAAAKGKVSLIIAAVLFENGTGDGERNDLTSLEEVRIGVVSGFQKIVPILQEVVNTNGMAISEEQIQTVTKKIEQLDDKNIPDNSKRGYMLVKDYMIFELNEINKKINSDSNFNLGEKFAAKSGEFEARLAKLNGRVPSNSEKERRQK